jgi:hypothetical protein
MLRHCSTRIGTCFIRQERESPRRNGIVKSSGCWFDHVWRRNQVGTDVLNLCPAFDMAFDEEHIRRAREKCGYVPSTRAALLDPKV